MLTVQASSPRDVLSRIEMMVLMSGADLPIGAVRGMVAGGIDLIVHQARFREGSRRITQISEVVWTNGGNLTLQDIFLYNHQAIDEQGRQVGGLRPTGLRPWFVDKLADNRVRVDPRIFTSGENP